MWWFRKKSEKVRVSQSQIVGVSEARGMGRENWAYTTEGYGANVIVNRCVSLISRGMGSIRLIVQVDGEDAPDHPLQTLLDKPNPNLKAQSTLIEQLIGFHQTTGNSYLEAVRMSDQSEPLELWVWPSQQMEVLLAEGKRIPRGYKWSNGQDELAWAVDPLTGQSDMLHFKTFNPNDPYLGQSPMQAIASSIDQHNAAGDWNFKMLKNSAQPSGVLKTTKILTDDQWLQLQKRMEFDQMGPDNAKRPMILEGDLDWQQLGLSPSDMDWFNGKQMSAREIAGGYGVPTQVIPIQGDQTFANYEQARSALWEDTVIPLENDLVENLNAWLVPMYDTPGLSITFDIDSIPALEPRRAEKWAAIGSANWLTINEKREATGYDQLEGEAFNQVFIPAGQIPADFDPFSTGAPTGTATAQNPPNSQETTPQPEMTIEPDEDEIVQATRLIMAEYKCAEATARIVAESALEKTAACCDNH